MVSAPVSEKSSSISKMSLLRSLIVRVPPLRRWREWETIDSGSHFPLRFKWESEPQPKKSCAAHPFPKGSSEGGNGDWLYTVEVQMIM